MTAHSIAQLAVGFGDAAVKALAAFILASLAVLLLRKRPAAVRHLVWAASFAIALVVPIIGALAPAKPVAVYYEKPFLAPVPETEHYGNIPTEKLDSELSSLSIKSPHVSGRNYAKLVVAHDLGAVKAQSRDSLGFGRATALEIALVVWMFGVLVLAVQYVVGFFALMNLGRNSRRVGGAHLELAQRIAIASGIAHRRRWELRVATGSNPAAAMTWGVFNPKILLPGNSERWSEERLEAVLLHEFAHVRRRDSLSQLVAALACMVYWFNPLCWLCARAMRAEAELAADDTVIRLGVKPSTYARELVRIAAELGYRRLAFSPIGVPIMKQPKIESRIKSILDPSSRQRRGLSSLEALGTVLAAGVAMLPLVMLKASIGHQSVSAGSLPGAVVFAGIPSVPLTTVKVGFQSSQSSAKTQAKKKAEKTARKASKLAEEYAQLAAERAKLKAERANLESMAAKLESEKATMKAEKSQLKAEMLKSQLDSRMRELPLLELQKSQMRSSDDALQRVREQLDRQKALYKEGVIDKGVLEKLQANMDSMAAIKASRQALIDDAKANRQQAMALLQQSKAKIDFDLATKSLDRINSLFKEGVVGGDQLDKARAALAKAEAQLQYAETLLKSLKDKK